MARKNITKKLKEKTLSEKTNWVNSEKTD